MSKTNPKRGDLWKGPKGIFDGEEVGHRHGFYALTDDGKDLLKVRGKPVRLTHVDLAPGDEYNGDEEFRVAGPKDPGTVQGNLVDLQVDAQGNSGVGV